MKPIELTEKHKDKLIEMCKALFPEYKIGFENDNSDINVMDINIDEWGTNKGYTWTTGSIHWFEFCITHLFLKVFPDTDSMSFGKPCKNSNSIQHYEYLIYWLAGYPEHYFGKKVNLKTYHPIDYLYKHFKKLKH